MKVILNITLLWELLICMLMFQEKLPRILEARVK